MSGACSRCRYFFIAGTTANSRREALGRIVYLLCEPGRVVVNEQTQMKLS